jgi:hypothetical protein
MKYKLRGPLMAVIGVTTFLNRLYICYLLDEGSSRARDTRADTNLWTPHLSKITILSFQSVNSPGDKKRVLVYQLEAKESCR